MPIMNKCQLKRLRPLTIRLESFNMKRGTKTMEVYGVVLTGQSSGEGKGQSGFLHFSSTLSEILLSKSKNEVQVKLDI